MHYETALTVAVTFVVALPYLLVLLWCLALSLGDMLPDWQIPKPIWALLFAGGILSLCARQDRFWSHMLWFPAYTLVSVITRSEPTMVFILGLHLFTTLVLYLCDDRLAAMGKPQPA